VFLLKGKLHHLIHGKTLQLAAPVTDNLTALENHIVNFVVQMILIVMKKPQFPNTCVQGKIDRLLDG
jgi:hypothetical protein